MLLLALPIALMVRLRIPMIDKLLLAVGKMAGGLAALGLLLHWLVAANNLVLSLLFVIVLFVMAAFVAVAESRQPRGRVLLRIPLIPGVNDSAEDMYAFAEKIRSFEREPSSS